MPASPALRPRSSGKNDGVSLSDGWPLASELHILFQGSGLIDEVKRVLAVLSEVY